MGFYLFDIWTSAVDPSPFLGQQRGESVYVLTVLTEANDSRPQNNSVYSLCLLCIQVCNNTSDRKHADTTLESYVTETVMSIVTTFFSSPFSDQSTSLQVMTPILKYSWHICTSKVCVAFSCQFQLNFGSPPSTAVWFLWWKYMVIFTCGKINHPDNIFLPLPCLGGTPYVRKYL